MISTFSGPPAPQPAQAQFTTMALLQPEVLVSLERQGGEALVNKLILLFCQLAPQRVASLAPAAALQRPEEARLAAHGLAPLAAQVGAPRLRALAEAAEDALRSNDRVALAHYHDLLVGCCQQVCEALQSRQALRAIGA